MESESKYQQELVLKEQYKKLDMLDGANESLDEKAKLLLQINALLVAVLTLLGVPKFISDNPSVLVAVVLSIALTIFGITVYLTLYATLPRKYETPGKKDWDLIFKNYLGVSEEECFDQVLSNVIFVNTNLSEVNAAKSRDIKIASRLLVGQVIFLIFILVTFVVFQVV